MDALRLGAETNFQEALRNHPGLGAFGVGRELKHLPTMLNPGEFLQDILQGAYADQTGVLIRTTTRLVFLGKGIVRTVVEEFSIDNVTSVQYSTGLLMGEVTSFASGNKAQIAKTVKDHTKAFVDGLRSQLRIPRAVGATGQSVAQDPTASLEKLASLREKGFLSDEEFGAAKRRVLDEHQPASSIENSNEEVEAAVRDHGLNGFTIRQRSPRTVSLHRSGFPVRTLSVDDSGVLWYRDGNSAPVLYRAAVGALLSPSVQPEQSPPAHVASAPVVARAERPILGATAVVSTGAGEEHGWVSKAVVGLISLLLFALLLANLLGPKRAPARTPTSLPPNKAGISEQAGLASPGAKDASALAQGRPSDKVWTPEDAGIAARASNRPVPLAGASKRDVARVVEFCRAESLARLKYTRTIEWLDSAKQEASDTWMVSGIRTAQGPGEEVEQQFTCRVQVTNDKQRLRMIQIFSESSKTGRDVFEVR